MPTLWEVDHELWRLIKPLIDAAMLRKRTGRPPVDRRKVLDCNIHRMWSGCPWNQLPRTPGSDRTAHRCFQRCVVEPPLGRLSKCRAILVRYDKNPSNDLGMIQ